MKKCCATKKRSFWNEEAVTIHCWSLKILSTAEDQLA